MCFPSSFLYRQSRDRPGGGGTGVVAARDSVQAGRWERTVHNIAMIRKGRLRSKDHHHHCPALEIASRKASPVRGQDLPRRIVETHALQCLYSLTPLTIPSQWVSQSQPLCGTSEVPHTVLTNPTTAGIYCTAVVFCKAVLCRADKALC